MPTSSTTAAPLNVLSLGGSRNIGYYSALKLLKTGATVTFLLRNPAMFDADTAMQPYLASGQVRRVKGDGLVKDDVARAWAEAARERSKIDYLIFTVGGKPRFAGLSRGFVIDPPNLVTQCLLNALSTIPSSLPQQPRILVITAAGITPTSHASLPFVVKPLFKHFVAVPHADKLGAEKVLHYLTAGLPSWNPSTDGEPPAEVLPSGWERTTGGLPQPGTLQHVMILRPSILTDGESLGDKYDVEDNRAKGKKTKTTYRVSAEGDLGGYTVSRKDVAHFVADVVLNRWDTFENKIVNISY